MNTVSRVAPLLIVAGLLAACAESRHPELDDEATRIAAHLERVSRQLWATPTPQLSPEQRRAREESLRWLDQYRAYGVFPHNHVLLGERSPVFVDPHGTPCAVGFLLLRSGEEELVEEVVRDANLVRVPELGSDVRLVRWLDGRGLTLEEAARIQPQYGGTPSEPVTFRDTGYEAVTVGLSILTAATTSYSLMTEPQVGGIQWAEIGNVASLIGHTFMLLSSFDEENEESGWANGLNVVGSLVATVATVDRFSRRRRVESEARSQAVASPLIRPGPNGFEVGLTVRR